MLTEVYRPSRSEYPRPSNPVEERRRANADRFIDSYTQQIAYPRLLLNHVGTVPFESDPERMAQREACWAEYLYKDPPPPSEWIWGRTILAEVVSREIMQAVLKHTLDASGAFIDLVPTSIDGSSLKGEPREQKGVDLCLIQMQQRSGETIMYPVCGIDVTVGGPALVEHKRNRPGLQAQIAMPAAVLPLGEFKWGPERDISFNAYLDEHARTEILEKGVYTPFYGLDDVDIEEWKRILRREMQVSLTCCRNTLQQQFPGRMSPADYPYLKDVMDKIQQTKRLVRGKPLPLPGNST